MKSLLTCLMILSATFALRSQDVVMKSTDAPSTLIELYSSEGCSSCPPAEAWLNDLKKSPALWKTIFPLGFHVDYWDKLGWPDRFASNSFTRRQRNYASVLGQDSMYTPEFIVNGKEWRQGGFGGRSLPTAGAAKSGQLTLTLNGRENTISADFSPGADGPKKALVLNVAVLGFNLVTDVKAGENSGRKLEHDFVVLGFGTSPLAAKSDGTYSAPITIKTLTGDAPRAIVAWVSAEDGSIVQIVGGWLTPTESVQAQ